MTKFRATMSRREIGRSTEVHRVSLHMRGLGREERALRSSIDVSGEEGLEERVAKKSRSGWAGQS